MLAPSLGSGQNARPRHPICLVLAPAHASVPRQMRCLTWRAPTRSDRSGCAAGPRAVTRGSLSKKYRASSRRLVRDIERGGDVPRVHVLPYPASRSPADLASSVTVNHSACPRHYFLGRIGSTCEMGMKSGMAQAAEPHQKPRIRSAARGRVPWRVRIEAKPSPPAGVSRSVRGSCRPRSCRSSLRRRG